MGCGNGWEKGKWVFEIAVLEEIQLQVATGQEYDAWGEGGMPLEVQEMGVQSAVQEKVAAARPPAHRGCDLMAGASASRTCGRQKDRDPHEAVRSERPYLTWGPVKGCGRQ